MTTATTNSRPAWQAELTWGKRYYTVEEQAPDGESEGTPDGTVAAAPRRETVEGVRSVPVCFVDVSRPGCQPISFRVNHRKGRDVTFTDPRERNTGIAGVTGLWGTLPAPRE